MVGGWWPRLRAGDLVAYLDEKEYARLLKAAEPATADAGTGYELFAITAVVLGGTSIFGGVGSVHGTLLGVALFHRHTLGVALAGLAAVAAWKIAFTGFDTGPGLAGFVAHFAHEWVKLSNLLGLLLGFALIARHFEKSHVPALLPRYLPDDWKGAFAMLVIVFVLSAFLDNIAAALIGGAMAHTAYATVLAATLFTEGEPRA